jgi:hypothetical protein
MPIVVWTGLCSPSQTKEHAYAHEEDEDEDQGPVERAEMV